MVKNTLEADSIRLSYNNRLILSDISIRCETGSVTGILGRNGCGKSTLLQIIFGSTVTQDGIIRINGVKAQPAFKQPWRVALLPQFPFLPPGLTLHKAFGAFELNVSDFTERVPQFRGLEYEQIGELSYGMSRLAEIFLLIKKESMFVLLDEPFSALPPVAREQVQEWIEEERNKKGFIISDHDYDSVLRICDRLYLLRDGKTWICRGRDDLAAGGYLPE
ncbi:ATP-binding cassette domain-containing protein [Rurimicrobium arvi]|uniref:ATP-binding cassette domain-containing protein n=2 Tax=Rurimicrobium arvi TaxID=2049916 RepID=A0ABP8MXK5_9BACT